MDSPILSITVPTYNRVERLSGTLAAVLPQLVPSVELLVCDNCSPDGTWQYLQGLPPHVRRVRQPENIGSARNLMDCIARSKGEYLWLLCDDDKASETAVAEIVRAIERFDKPPLIYLRTTSRPVCSRPNAEDSFWVQETSDEFVKDISHWITFCSSIVVRRDCLDIDFLTRQMDTFLLPAALALSVAAKEKRVVVSSGHVLSAMCGEPGAYDAVGIFSKNLRQLLNLCVREKWFDARTMNHLYEDNLNHVVGAYLQSKWPVPVRSFVNLIVWSFDCPVLYSRLLPLMFRRIVWNRMLGWKRRVFRTIRTFLCEMRLTQGS